MTATSWIFFIRNSPSLEKLYNKLTVDERRKAYDESDGETFGLDQIFENILEDRNEQRQQGWVVLVVRVPDRWVRDGHCFEIGLNEVTLG